MTEKTIDLSVPLIVNYESWKVSLFLWVGERLQLGLDCHQVSNSIAQ